MSTQHSDYRTTVFNVVFVVRLCPLQKLKWWNGWVASLQNSDSEKRKQKERKVMQCVVFLWNSLLKSVGSECRMRLSSASGVLSFLPQSLGLLGQFIDVSEMSETRERSNPKRFKAFNCSPRTLRLLPQRRQRHPFTPCLEDSVEK